MHQPLESIARNEIIESDICIIGAGAAGITLALELDRLGHKVLLLESGTFEYDAEVQEMNKGENVGQPYFPLASSRLRFFGGTTNHWTGQCSILDEQDFKERP
ncbi:FAD-dependent oxidoreductase [Maribacter sp. 2307ULW6-5]|uniref:FAD-dependent oxidoreductase n=1 Tax=Maribacter sp. 2307ULW6-5 TaxID=3386275 RepID=UPI0039BC666D